MPRPTDRSSRRGAGKSEPPQRNALAPGLLALIVCVVSTFVLGDTWEMIARFALTILALICAWFAVQARQWWWLLLYVPVAVLWNPILPIDHAGTPWLVAHLVVGVGFVIAGLRITTERAS